MQVIHFADLAENGNDVFDNGKKSFSKIYIACNIKYINFNFNIKTIYIFYIYVRLIIF